MPSSGITPKAGHIFTAALGLLCLAWSFRYFDPIAPTARFSKLPRPPQGDVPEYPKIEDLTAAAEARHPFRSTRAWYFGATGDDAVVETEQWFRLPAVKSATISVLGAQAKTYDNTAASTAIQRPELDNHTGTGAGSLEEYVAPVNTTVLRTALGASEDVPSPTAKSNPGSSSEHDSETTTAQATAVTPLLLYAYSPASWALPNLQFFLKQGLRSSATFVFVINGALVPGVEFNQSSSYFINSTETDVLDVLKILEPYAEKHPNVQIWKRPNTCYDLGAYAEVLKTDSFSLTKSHEKFIFINASLRGPFVPFWSQECWSDAYLRLLDTRNADNTTDYGPVKLPWKRTLIGSNATLSLTYTNVGIDACPTNMEEAVNIEVSLTSLIQSHNYTVRAMMAEYWSKQDYEMDCTNGDANAAKGAYDGGDLGVFETLSIKTRWAVEADQTERLTQWYAGAVESRMSSGAWDKCGKAA